MAYFCSHRMMGVHKFSLKTFFIATAIITLFCALTPSLSASGIGEREIYTTLTQDTIKPRKKANLRRPDATLPQQQQILPATQPVAPVIINGTRTPLSDTIPGSTDSLQQANDTFSLRISKDTLDAPINYEAEDSVVVFVPEKKIILYGKTKTTQKDIVLTAPKVELDQATNIVTAYNETDSTGYVITRARFEQGANQFESDEIKFNFKTQQGFTKNTFTKQDDFFVQGETVKKINENTLFIKQGRFTTCNLDEPHFDFFAKRMKVVNNKVAVTGLCTIRV